VYILSTVFAIAIIRITERKHSEVVTLVSRVEQA